MAPSKSAFLFVCFLVATTVVVVPASAQLLGGIIGNIPFLNGLLGLFQGTLFCSPNLNAVVGSNGTILSPRLANVPVQLRCGPGNGTVVATSTTNAAGQFSILNLLSLPFTLLTNTCRLAVNTPIAQCNATVPAVGTLVSKLISNGTTTLGGLRIPIFNPNGGFSVGV